MTWWGQEHNSGLRELLSRVKDHSMQQLSWDPRWDAQSPQGHPAAIPPRHEAVTMGDLLEEGPKGLSSRTRGRDGAGASGDAGLVHRDVLDCGRAQ